MFWDLLFHTLVSRSMPKSTVYKLEISLPDLVYNLSAVVYKLSFM